MKNQNDSLKSEAEILESENVELKSETDFLRSENEKVKPEIEALKSKVDDQQICHKCGHNTATCEVKSLKKSMSTGVHSLRMIS